MIDPIRVMGTGRYYPAGVPEDFFVSGQINASYLPSYVDDVIEVANYASLPSSGESGKIYVVDDENQTYRWSGTGYIEIPSNNLDTIEDNTINSVADVLALSPLRRSTIYVNPDTGARWIVDHYNNVHTLEDGEYFVTLVTNNISLVAGQDTIIDINWPEGSASNQLLSRSPNILGGVDIETINSASMVIVARDSLNNNVLGITGWNIVQISTTQISITSNEDADVVITAQFPAVKQ